ILASVILPAAIVDPDLEWHQHPNPSIAHRSRQDPHHPILFISFFTNNLEGEGRESMAADLAPGTWALEKSENFDEYMKALGVSYPWRVIGNAAKPKQDISVSAGHWTIATSTPATKVLIKFDLNKQFDETTPDGRKVKSISTVEGNKLITHQKGAVDSVITRDFGKNSFVMTLAAKGQTCTRHYKRLS
ncbi:hypothetical protein EGW08_018380, partial [Elysia chlorotica]